MNENLLAGETSPYLLQHKDNPVHWRPWGDAALNEAQAANKPILLSVGYAACHWCHVMAHESFSDPDVAAVMNRLFVNIKVDREERPDVDALYMDALHLTGQPGGWPLTMFLTPAGEPFWGGTYFPKTASLGRAGFIDVLEGVARVWREQPDEVTKTREALTSALRNEAARDRSGVVPPELMDQAARAAMTRMDPAGGTIGAPKFPQTPLLEMLWRVGRRTDQPPLCEMVQVSLRAMCSGGLYDHLGGGFCRYCVDERWLVPHFEKMLYDNALLIDLLMLVWRASGSAMILNRVTASIEWMLREMQVDGGAFAASLDADSDGREGAFYVWSSDEIDRLLGKDAAAFKQAYGVSAGGNWEGVNILNRLDHQEDAEGEAVFAGARQVLFEARATRTRPGLDDKVLSDWNGLAIAALAQAGAVVERPDWIAAAADAFEFIATHMVRDGCLLHCWRQGEARHPATADGYANMMRAALALHEATGEEHYLATAVAWFESFDRLHRAEAGGWFFTGDGGGLIARQRHANDGATPSANATMLGVLARLAVFTGDPSHSIRAGELERAFAGDLARQPLAMADFLNGLDDVRGMVQVVLAGSPGETAALRRAAFLSPVPSRVVVPRVGESHPAAAASAGAKTPAAFICRGATCQPPVHDPARLAEAMG